MKALKSKLAAFILATPSGAKGIREWLSSGLPRMSVWHLGKLYIYILSFVGRAK